LPETPPLSQWVLRYVGHLVQAKIDLNDFISTVLLRDSRARFVGIKYQSRFKKICQKKLEWLYSQGKRLASFGALWRPNKQTARFRRHDDVI